ncbi:MAG: TonB-dependent receptor domain-containing protein [Rhodothermaceae bacterium]
MKKIILLIIFFTTVFAGINEPGGEISGKVVDKNTKLPLIGVNVYVNNKNVGTTTDVDGKYNIKNLPVGDYEIIISYLGYKKQIKSNVIVRSGRVTYLNVEMAEESIKMDQVVVSAGYFTELEEKPVSAINFSNEEIRRAPGAAGDISRILTSLPSLAKVNDQKNSMVVRGGSPVENTFILDNIEIPNINHFPVQGSSGGGLALINVDFIEELTFNAGGFGAAYGDKLSSVMELKFREGDKNKFYPQFNFSMMGFGFSAEGPIVKDKVSFLAAVNKSYTDLILSSVNAGGAVPNYSDFQGKLTWDINKRHKISLIDIFANDKIDLERKKVLKEEENTYGKTNSITNVAGINWRFLWGKKGYSNTSVAHNFIEYDWDYNFTQDDNLFLKNKTREETISFRNVNYFNFSKKFQMEFGLEAKYLSNKFDFHYGATVNEFGNLIPETKIKDNLEAVKAASFLNFTLKAGKYLTIKPGVRADYFDYTDELVVDPRIGLALQVSETVKINMAAGVYHQNIPMNILVQNEAFKDLKTPVAFHFVAGFTKMLSPQTKLTVEVYEKKYQDFPVDPTQPKSFLFDETTSNTFSRAHNELKDNGEAYARGVEMTIQKKMASGFYGLISASYSKTRYKDVNGDWHDRIYDNELMFALEGGYKPNNSWEFSAKWLYGGGIPYTPFDLVQSAKLRKGIYDTNKINSERLPAYHSLNLRVDKRFNFANSNLVVYLDVWNVYGRENIAGYVWNEISNEVKKVKQWSTMPILGVEWEL